MLVRYLAGYLGLPSLQDHLEKFKYLKPNTSDPMPLTSLISNRQHLLRKNTDMHDENNADNH